MQLKSQKMRKLAPELDPLRIGTGWTKEDLGKVQVIVESTYGDSHPGSGHLNILEEEVRKGIAEEGGFGARSGVNHFPSYTTCANLLPMSFLTAMVSRSKINSSNWRCASIRMVPPGVS